jgi:BirA family biotin operon repressor/biotin-[acetyl-CoA-carboxylase] ligase
VTLRQLARCGSTNDEAARWARQGAPHGAAVLAQEQDRGRGRLGHTWHSPPGGNLYLSVVLRPALRPAQAPLLTLCAGVAVAEAIDAELQRAPGSPGVMGRRAQIGLKWPNDLLLRASREAPFRKVGGILTEMVCAGEDIDFVVVGIGVNLDLPAAAFPPELAGQAISLAAVLMRPPLSAPFAEEVVARVLRWTEVYVAEGAAPVCARFQALAVRPRVGEPVAVRTGAGVIAGSAAGLAEDGALLVRDPEGVTHRVLAGVVE